MVSPEMNPDELLRDAKEQTANRAISLQDVQRLAEQQKLLEDEVAALEAQVLVKKAELKKVAEEELPELLDGVGLPSITLKDGTVLEVGDLVSASITDDNRAPAHSWLRENQLGDLIKNVLVITFGKGEDEEAIKLQSLIKAMAEKDELRYGTLEQKEAVHPSTLKSFVKERLESGLPLPAQTFKLFIGRVCRIKKPRVKK